MKKDFKKWHDIKENIHNNNGQPYFYEREIWFCSIGCNVGSEEDGKHKNFERPVLILKKINSHTFWGIPLTSKIKKGKYHYMFFFNNKISIAKLSQLRLFDAKRLSRKFGIILYRDFSNLKNLLKKLI